MVREKRGGDHPFFVQGRNVPEVIAHRGGAGEWPGETIYAFEEAVKLGVDVLEMDIRYTSDDVLVLMHDESLLETTGVDKRVSDLTSEEVRGLDAAYRWRQAGKVFPPGARLGVPALEEVFQSFPGRRMNIEIKPHGFPLRLIKEFRRLLEKYEMTDKVLVASASDTNLLFFRRECPGVATSASVLEMATFRALKSFRYRPDADAIQTTSKLGSVHFITRGYVEAVHKVGLKVHGWTVNEQEEMERLIPLGIDGIITDYPTTLLKLLGRLS